MNRLELWGGVFAAIGGILLALGALNTLFSSRSLYVLFS